MNYFSFFGLSPKVYLDEKELRRAYHSKMMSLHPDMHMSADANEKEELLTQSAFNNTAYNILRDFHSRLNYIVEEYGVASEEKVTMPQMFLMEMMDVNEEIMELQMSVDEVKIAKTRMDIESQLDDLKNEVLKSIESIELENELDESRTKLISEYLLKRNYLNRILSNLEKMVE